jgi:hypothetical protein
MRRGRGSTPPPPPSCPVRGDSHRRRRWRWNGRWPPASAGAPGACIRAESKVRTTIEEKSGVGEKNPKRHHRRWDSSRKQWNITRDWRKKNNNDGTHSSFARLLARSLASALALSSAPLLFNSRMKSVHSDIVVSAASPRPRLRARLPRMRLLAYSSSAAATQSRPASLVSATLAS